MAKDKAKAKSKAKAKDKSKSKGKETAAVWYEETFHPDWRVRFRADKVLHEVETEHQHLVIFENAFWGRCLLLDGVFQLTTRDEFVYHEMMAHIPLMSHERPKRALVIGGGDGGVLREVLKHPSIEEATLCEIDRDVIDTSLKYYPQISAGAFKDPRTTLQIGDGFKFVQEAGENGQTFDAIIVDSSEPIGPSAVLHSAEFFKACRGALSDGGVLIAQNGLPFTDPGNVANVTTALTRLFKWSSPCLATHPCYFGGSIALNTATQGTPPPEVPVTTLKGRASRRKIETKYWTPQLHQSAFVMPGYVAAIVETARAKAKRRG